MPVQTICFAGMALLGEMGQSLGLWGILVAALSVVVSVVALLLSLRRYKIEQKHAWASQHPAVEIQKTSYNGTFPLSKDDLITGTTAEVTNIGKGPARLIRLRLRTGEFRSDSLFGNLTLEPGKSCPLPDIKDLNQRALMKGCVALLQERRQGRLPPGGIPASWPDPELWIDFEDSFGNLHHQSFVINQPKIIFERGETRFTRHRWRHAEAVGITTARYCFCVLLALGGRKISRLDLYPWQD